MSNDPVGPDGVITPEFAQSMVDFIKSVPPDKQQEAANMVALAVHVVLDSKNLEDYIAKRTADFEKLAAEAPAKTRKHRR